MFIVLLFVLVSANVMLLPRVFVKIGTDWRIRFLGSVALSGGFLVLVTEGISAFRLLEQRFLVITWITVILVIGSVLFLRRKGSKWISFPIDPALDRVEIILIIGITVLTAIMGWIAYVAAPNNDDSMLYHLTRVAQWQQNQSVAFFPAHNIKQLVFSPFAEYVLVNFHILSGSDHYDNLLQWFAMILSTLGVTYLTKKLGAPRLVQIFSAIFVLTLPMSVYQSSTTQNDLVSSMWIVFLVCFAFAYYEDQNLYNAFMVGLSISLAIFTKATAYIYVSIIVLALISALIIKRVSFKSTHILIAVILVLCLNTPFWMRNYDLTGSPLGPGELSRLHINEEFSLSGVTLNLVRNLGSNLFFLEEWAGNLTENLGRILSILGININDSRFTFPDYEYQLPGYSIEYTGAYLLHVMIGGHSVSEETIGHPLHLLIVGIALFSLFLQRKKIGSKSWIFYAFFWSAMLVMFSGYLRWQLYGNRLLLPWFILAAPFSSLGLFYLINSKKHAFKSQNNNPSHRQGMISELTDEVELSRKNRKNNSLQDYFRLMVQLGQNAISPGVKLFCIASFLIVCTIPLFYSNPKRPIWQDWNIFNMSRSDVMIQNLELRREYNNAVGFIVEQGCRAIGLIGDGEEWEYPIWSLFRDQWGDSFRIANVLVENESGSISLVDFQPCVLLVLSKGEPEQLSYDQIVFGLTLDQDTADLYFPEK